jgi:hypothetical protein
MRIPEYPWFFGIFYRMPFWLSWHRKPWKRFRDKKVGNTLSIMKNSNSIRHVPIVQLSGIGVVQHA